MESRRHCNNKILFSLVFGIGFVCMGVLYRSNFPRGSRRLAPSKGRTEKKFFSMNCDMEQCVNYTRCPIANKFSVYIYPTIYSLHNQLDTPANNRATSTSTSTSLLLHLHRTISKNHQITQNPKEACVYIVLVDSCRPRTILQNKSKSQSHVWGSAKSLSTPLRYFVKKKLQFWTPDGNGINHLIWLADDDCLSSTPPHFRVHNSRFGRAMVISETFWKSNFRPHFDFVVSHLSIEDEAESKPGPGTGPGTGTGQRNKTASTDILRQPALPLFPIRRKYLATYLPDKIVPPSEEMKLLHKLSLDKPALFKFPSYFADSKNATPPAALQRQSNIVLRDLLVNSTFSLVMLHPSRAFGFGVTGSNSTERNQDEFLLTTTELQRKLYMVLSSGSIPVVIGAQFHFPFSEFIDWSQIAITVPRGRLKELSQILEAIPDSDISKFRKNGRRAFVKYLSSIENVVETLLAGVRTRIGIPPPPYDAVLSLSAFPDNASKPVDRTFDFNLEMGKAQNASGNWSLAPMGKSPFSFSSPNFIRNVSSSLFLDKYSLWNVHYQPFRLFPSTPWDVVVPAEAHVKVPVTLKNKTVVKRVRPAYGGGGRDTKLFRTSLGGNIPPEQFTIVVLTFKRDSMLMKLLKMFVGLSYLRSVLVVWNCPDYPLKNLTWPEIGVPVHVIKSTKNSLNNRFIPYDEIETEAILSMDDDSLMSHEEIIFTFRIWRENRERIVGLPGRFHEWNALNSAWTYGAYASCELSMVLTGAAFYHKYYAYMYTFEMPAAIRAKVDTVTNCEDIAINFLIAHLTQKPPIKVTGRDQFNCFKCTKSLSKMGPYYHRRHDCLNAFTKVYGYMPLLYTQFRANSLQHGSRSQSRCFENV